MESERLKSEISSRNELLTKIDSETGGVEAVCIPSTLLTHYQMTKFQTGPN